MTIKEMALEIQEEVVAFRRDIHQHPELSMQEFRTTQKVAEVMDRLGIPYRLTDPTGLVAEIRGTLGESKRCVLLRADMDALNIQEETGLPFSSKNDGVMHACGHDTHTAMLVGAAKILQQLRDRFAGTVRLVFQPSEETGRGADLMITQGAGEGVDMAMSLHINAPWPAGVMKVRKGPVAASTDAFTIKVIGKGCHGAAPHHGADPIYASAAIIQQLQTMVSREFAPIDPVVVSVCQINAGTRFNIIPETAEIIGNCRTYSNRIWEQLPAVMERIATHTAAALRCRAEVTFDRVTKPLCCDAAAVEIMEGSIQKIIDDPSQTGEAPMQMGGEDFASFGACCPIVWVQLGGDGGAPMHSSRVNLDERALPSGVACYAQFAVDALEKLNRTEN